MQGFIDAITSDDRLEHQASFLTSILLCIEDNADVDQARADLGDYISVIPESEQDFKAACQKLADVLDFIAN